MSKLKQIGTTPYMGRDVPQYYIELIYKGDKYLSTTIHPTWDAVPAWSEKDTQSMIGRMATHMSTTAPSKIKRYRKCIMVNPQTGEFVEESPGHDSVLLEDGSPGHAHYFNIPKND